MNEENFDQKLNFNDNQDIKSRISKVREDIINFSTTQQKDEIFSQVDKISKNEQKNEQKPQGCYTNSQNKFYDQKYQASNIRAQSDDHQSKYMIKCLRLLQELEISLNRNDKFYMPSLIDQATHALRELNYDQISKQTHIFEEYKTNLEQLIFEIKEKNKCCKQEMLYLMNATQNLSQILKIIMEDQEKSKRIAVIFLCKKELEEAYTGLEQIYGVDGWKKYQERYVRKNASQYINEDFNKQDLQQLPQSKCFMLVENEFQKLLLQGFLQIEAFDTIVISSGQRLNKVRKSLYVHRLALRQCRKRSQIRPQIISIIDHKALEKIGTINEFGKIQQEIQKLCAFYEVPCSQNNDKESQQTLNQLIIQLQPFQIYQFHLRNIIKQFIESFNSNYEDQDKAQFLQQKLQIQVKQIANIPICVKKAIWEISQKLLKEIIPEEVSNNQIQASQDKYSNQTPKSKDDQTLEKMPTIVEVHRYSNIEAVLKELQIKDGQYPRELVIEQSKDYYSQQDPPILQVIELQQILQNGLLSTDDPQDSCKIKVAVGDCDFSLQDLKELQSLDLCKNYQFVYFYSQREYTYSQQEDPIFNEHQDILAGMKTQSFYQCGGLFRDGQGRDLSSLDFRNQDYEDQHSLQGQEWTFYEIPSGGAVIDYINAQEKFEELMLEIEDRIEKDELDLEYFHGDPQIHQISDSDREFYKKYEYKVNDYKPKIRFAEQLRNGKMDTMAQMIAPRCLKGFFTSIKGTRATEISNKYECIWTVYLEAVTFLHRQGLFDDHFRPNLTKFLKSSAQQENFHIWQNNQPPPFNPAHLEIDKTYTIQNNTINVCTGTFKKIKKVTCFTPTNKQAQEKIKDYFVMSENLNNSMFLEENQSYMQKDGFPISIVNGTFEPYQEDEELDFQKEFLQQQINQISMISSVSQNDLEDKQSILQNAQDSVLIDKDQQQIALILDMLGRDEEINYGSMQYDSFISIPGYSNKEMTMDIYEIQDGHKEFQYFMTDKGFDFNDKLSKSFKHQKVHCAKVDIQTQIPPQIVKLAHSYLNLSISSLDIS